MDELITELTDIHVGDIIVSADGKRYQVVPLPIVTANIDHFIDLAALSPTYSGFSTSKESLIAMKYKKEKTRK